MDRRSNLIYLSLPVIFLALTIKQSPIKSARTHPFCTLHPASTTLCEALTRLTGGDAYLPTSILPLTEALVRIPSPSGREQAVTAFVKSWLTKHSFKTTLQKIPPLCRGQPARQNILAYTADVSAIRVVLATHLDTVPAAVTVSKSAWRLYGRGATDAKVQAAAMMLTAVEMADPRVAVLFLAGEETDHAGMLRAHELGIADDVAMVNGEPTRGRVVTFQKGMLKGVLKAQGVAAHSGYPHLGSSAVHVLVRLLNELLEVQWPVVDGVETSLNVGVVRGGSAPNVLADEASATVMFRLGGQPEEILKLLGEILERYEHVKWETVTKNGPYEFFVPKRAGEAFGTDVVAFNTDVPYYQGSLGRAVLFGAGSIEQAHTVDEYIEMSQLEALPRQLESIVEELLEIDE